MDKVKKNVALDKLNWYSSQYIYVRVLKLWLKIQFSDVKIMSLFTKIRYLLFIKH